MASYSFSSVDNVRAFTYHLLDGQTNYNSTTRPTFTDVRNFLERASSHLNSALATRGFTVPVSTKQVRIACDDWVTSRAVEYVELTQRGTGYNSGDGSRSGVFGNLQPDALDFVKSYELGWKRLGAAVSQSASQGLQFTGLDAQDQRTDPDDSSLAQPLFKRGLFDEPTGSGYLSSEEEDDD